MRKHAAANDAIRTVHPMDNDVHRSAPPRSGRTG